MCGNGGRCIVAFARDLGLIDNETVFLAVDGRHEASIQDNQVRLGMVNVDHYTMDGEAFVLNTGSPHYVQFVDDLANLNVGQLGAEIRNAPTYVEQGINVNFVEQEADGNYFVRTFERGVEAETYACGTGAVASAMSVALQSGMDNTFSIPIRVLGGALRVEFQKQGHHFSNVFLLGPAKQVFTGHI